MREIIQPKIEKITCNKCQAECSQPNGFASFIYLILGIQDKILKQKVIEEHYCQKHADKIREFISKME